MSIFVTINHSRVLSSLDMQFNMLQWCCCLGECWEWSSNTSFRGRMLFPLFFNASPYFY